MSQSIQLATVEDGEEILQLLEKSTNKAPLDLIYTRRPNVYTSYINESRDSRLYVIKEDERLIASFACIPRTLWMDGVPKKVGYICGVKKDEKYKQNVNWYRAILRTIKDVDMDYFFCSILKDNNRAVNLFEKERKYLMNMNNCGEYITYILKPYFKFNISHSYSFRQATKKDENNIIEFINKESREKNLAPVIKNIEEYKNLKIEDFYILENSGNILGVAALWNQTNYRQYIVKKYRGIFKFIRILNPVLSRLGYISMPKENEVLNFPMLSFFITKDNDMNYYKIFLNNINKIISKEYGIYVIGAHKDSLQNDIYKKLRNLHFNSKIYLLDTSNIRGKVEESFDNNMQFNLECGML